MDWFCWNQNKRTVLFLRIFYVDASRIIHILKANHVRQLNEKEKIIDEKYSNNQRMERKRKRNW